MNKSESYVKKISGLQRQLRSEIVRLMRQSGQQEIPLLPKKSTDRVWVVFYQEYLSEYRTGYLDMVKYNNGELSFEIMWSNGDIIEISENSSPLFMDIPEVMIKIYKNLWNQINNS